MENFKIIKISSNNFKHILPNGSDLRMSDFEIIFLNGSFNLVMIDGSKTQNILISQTDIVVGGVTYNGFTTDTFIAKLKEISYTPYLTVLGFTDDQIESIQNAVGANGTNHLATMADVGSGLSQITKFIFDESAVTVPLGFSGAVINMTQPNSDVVYTVSGTSMTITGGADDGDVLIF